MGEKSSWQEAMYVCVNIISCHSHTPRTFPCHVTTTKTVGTRSRCRQLLPTPRGRSASSSRRGPQRRHLAAQHTHKSRMSTRSHHHPPMSSANDSHVQMWAQLIPQQPARMRSIGRGQLEGKGGGDTARLVSAAAAPAASRLTVRQHQHRTHGGAPRISAAASAARRCSHSGLLPGTLVAKKSAKRKAERR